MASSKVWAWAIQNFTIKGGGRVRGEQLIKIRECFVKANICNQSTKFYRVQCTLFYIENDAEIFPAHYTWKVAEKGFNMGFLINKLATINSCEIILEKKNCQKSL